MSFRTLPLSFLCDIRLSGYDAVGLEYFCDFFEGFLHLGFGVRCHKREADKGVLRCDGGRYDRIDEDAFFKQVACDGESLEVVADIERDDGRRRVADFESAAAETFESHRGKFPKLFLAFGF